MKMIMKARSLGGISIVLASCAGTTGIPYDKAAWNTESYLQSQAKKELFRLNLQRQDRSTEFQFNDGPFSKAAVAFPRRVKVTVSSESEGRDSSLSVSAEEHGLFWKENCRDIARKWRERILNDLSRNLKNSYQ